MVNGVAKLAPERSAFALGLALLALAIAAPAVAPEAPLGAALCAATLGGLALLAGFFWGAPTLVALAAGAAAFAVIDPAFLATLAAPAIALPRLFGGGRWRWAAAIALVAASATAVSLLAIDAEGALGAAPALAGAAGLGAAMLALAARRPVRTGPAEIVLGPDGSVVSLPRAARRLLDWPAPARARFALRERFGDDALNDGLAAARRQGASAVLARSGHALVIRQDAHAFRAVVIDLHAAIADIRAEERQAAQAGALRTAELSHELRTPLNHIIGFADLVQGEYFGQIGEKNREYLQLIGASARNLLQLINGLMDLSRIGAGHYTLERDRFDPRALIEEAVRLHSGEALRRGIALENETFSGALLIEADASALRQILTNLLTNALKFTPEGGRVRTSLAADARNLIIAVEDSGPGIPESERSRLTRPFERGAAAAGGAPGVGLGLALAHAFADLHDGTIAFEDSARLGGARVRVRLPVVVAYDPSDRNATPAA